MNFKMMSKLQFESQLLPGEGEGPNIKIELTVFFFLSVTLIAVEKYFMKVNIKKAKSSGLPHFSLNQGAQSPKVFNKSTSQIACFSRRFVFSFKVYQVPAVYKLRSKSLA